MDNKTLSFIPIGGMGDVTKNMYLYECGDEILIVDCGIGFADDTMLGVDLLLPDITYLLQTKKKIVGMLLTHGHEDHIGATPFILPQLPQIPVYATPFTAALTNEKLKEFKLPMRVKTVPFDNNTVRIGSFTASFIKVTHSVPDTSNILIKTPIGNFYHGSDHKFDDTPYDGNPSDYEKIKKAGEEGVLCLLSDCLGSERAGRTPTELPIAGHFERELANCKGKFIVTTYSSNVERLNQIIDASQKANRKVCFLGRSLIKVKDVAQDLGYMRMPPTLEVPIDQIKNYPDNQLTFIVAGSQGQENSALSRITNGEHREVKLAADDVVIFSADPIPGNEVSVYEVINTLAKKGIRTLYTPLSRDFHVSGHGSQEEILQLMEMIKAKRLIPIGGNYRHMVAYKNLAETIGYKAGDVVLLDDGQEVIFNATGQTRVGRTIPIKNVYVDNVSGEEIEHFVMRDRQKLSEGGIVIVLAQIDASTGQLIENPDIIIRGFPLDETKRISVKLSQDIRKTLSGKTGRVTNWMHFRKMIGDIAERRIFRELRRQPLVLPIVIEV
ncbi:MAG: ribonuclease J [Candidatus Levybacteria bacterium]|nr:ribonuclease J [Candidatus Levybacteria bacterium]